MQAGSGSRGKSTEPSYPYGGDTERADDAEGIAGQSEANGRVKEGRAWRDLHSEIKAASGDPGEIR